MSTDLRERLKALVAELREEIRDKMLPRRTRVAVNYCVERLAAILAESESRWVCSNCGNTEYREREVLCWRCGKGEMRFLAETESEPSFHDVTATRCLRHATIPPTIMPPATQECGLCMREEGILVGRIENRPETAWLIESRFTLTPSWWTGTGWSKDSLLAVRFCRKQDAEAEMPQLPEFNTCFASEHQWGLRESEQFLADIQEGKRLLMDEVRREREAALPLGHECCPCPKFMVCGEHPDGTPGVHCSLCGQPRSAHEPKPSPKPGK